MIKSQVKSQSITIGAGFLLQVFSCFAHVFFHSSFRDPPFFGWFYHYSLLPAILSQKIWVRGSLRHSGCAAAVWWHVGLGGLGCTEYHQLLYIYIYILLLLYIYIIIIIIIINVLYHIYVLLYYIILYYIILYYIIYIYIYYYII